MKTLIIIPFYNNLSDLGNLLRSLETEVGDRAPVYIVDNSDERGISKAVFDKFPGLRILGTTLPAKSGFTKAVNAGLIHAIENDYDFAWILNQDAQVQEGAYRALVGFLETNKNTAIVSSLILDAHHLDKVVFGGGLDIIPGVHQGGYVGNFSEATQQRWVTFCSVMLRLSSLRYSGLLDENFHMICSDSELCYRVRHYGFRVWLEPKSKVAHAEEGGFSRAANPSRDRERMKILRHDQTFFMAKLFGSRRFQELDNEVFPKES